MSHRTRSFSPPSRLSCWGRIFCRVVVLGFVTAVAYAQDVPLDPSAQNPPGARTGAAGATPDPQPYDKVITKDAKSKKGAFTVHEITEKYYYEIPRRELDKVFLWNTQIAKTVEGAGYGGQELSARVVRWELNRNSVHLRYINYNGAPRGSARSNREDSRSEVQPCDRDWRAHQPTRAG